MNQYKIPFNNLYSQYKELQNEIDESIKTIIKNSDFLTGKTTEEFENAICDYTGAEDCAAMSSGSDSLIASLKALNIGPNDQVLTVGHTFLSTTESIINVGAEPIFVDIDEFYLLDISQFKKTDRLKAILFVDLYGQTPDIDRILSFAKKHNLKVIEDAAQSFGSEYKGKKVGSLVDLTCFSFNPLKNLSAMGDAGAVTGKKEYIEKIKQIRNHGRGKSNKIIEGYNSRIDNIQAIILKQKLKKIDNWIDKKRIVCQKYTKELNSVVNCPKETSWSKHTYYVYVIEVPNGTRDKLKNYLQERGIETKIHYVDSTHKLNYIKNKIELPKTEYMSRNILSLPCYYDISNLCQQKVIDSIKEFYKNEKNITS
jgi:dTDP-4-amino-4,6-dideoxygalactose transaminase